MSELDAPPPIDPEAARAAVERILDDPAYDEPSQGLLDRALEWLLDRFDSAFGSATGGGPGNVIGWLFVVALVAAALWLLLRAVRVPSVSRRRPEALEYGTETHRDATVWLDEAARLAAVGDHRGAVRCRHQALVARLITEGVVDDVPGRTAGEYAGLVVASLPQVAAAMRELTVRFDDAWYGGAIVDAAGYQEFVRWCEAVEAEIASLHAETGPPAESVAVRS